MKKIRVFAPLLLIALLLSAASVYWYRSLQDKFAAPRKNAPAVKFRVAKENILMAVTGNLAYYGFVKDENALKYALEHTKEILLVSLEQLRLAVTPSTPRLLTTFRRP